jgi:hypothetical protein
VPRIRSIKPEIWEDEKLGRCSVLARLNFKGLISLADDAGRGPGTAAWLRGRLHAYAEDVTSDEMRTSLEELKQAGLAVFYEVKGQTYYYLPGFLKHQKINRPSPPRFPPPPAGLTESSRSIPRGLTEDSLRTHPRIEDQGSRIEDRGEGREGDQGREGEWGREGSRGREVLREEPQLGTEEEAGLSPAHAGSPHPPDGAAMHLTKPPTKKMPKAGLSPAEIAARKAKLRAQLAASDAWVPPDSDDVPF